MIISNEEYLQIKKCIDNIMNSDVYNKILSEKEYYLIMSYLRSSSKIIKDNRTFIIAKDIIYFINPIYYEMTTKYNPFNNKLRNNLIRNECLEITKTNNVYSKYILSYNKLISFLTDNKTLLSDGNCSVDEMNEYIGNSESKYSDPINIEDFYKTPSENKNKYVTRENIEYKLWMQDVLTRDEYTCQCCDSKLNPEVHHILNYAKYKELRIDVDNGITLCECCHSPMIKDSFHNTYGTRNNSKEQLQEYINNKRVELGLEPKTI